MQGPCCLCNARSPQPHPRAGRFGGEAASSQPRWVPLENALRDLHALRRTAHGHMIKVSYKAGGEFGFYFWEVMCPGDTWVLVLRKKKGFGSRWTMSTMWLIEEPAGGLTGKTRRGEARTGLSAAWSLTPVSVTCSSYHVLGTMPTHDIWREQPYIPGRRERRPLPLLRGYSGPAHAAAEGEKCCEMTVYLIRCVAK